MTDETTTKNLVAAVAERDRRIAELAQALLDSADKVDAVVSAAVAARVAAIRARVEALPRHAAMVAFNGDLPVVRLMPHPRAGTWLDSAATLSAIDATEGGAP